MEGECVDERACPVAWGGMDNYAGRFVDGEKVAIFVENMEREVFRGDGEIAGEGWELDLNPVAGGRFMGLGWWGTAIEEDVVVREESLYVCARDGLEARGEDFVEAMVCFGRVNLEDSWRGVENRVV